VQLVRGVIIFTPLQEKAVNVTSVLRCFVNVLMSDRIQNVVVISNHVNGELVLSRIVLKGASQESLREEEAREPELDGCAMFDPIVEEVNSLIAIVDPRGQRFERKEAHFGPDSGDLVVKYGVSKEL